MATTYFAFHPDDCVEVLEALDVKQMPSVLRTVGDLMVLARSGQAEKLAKLLEDRGISFNYASYAWAQSMSPKRAGQIRYGHDGTTSDFNLVPDPQMAALYNRNLPGEELLDDIQRLRICYVCCGQESWDNRQENGQMHKMRLLLT
ncbi:MAG: hypothetical protein J6N20_05030 [Pseudomonas sp.]|nr:hypothetical protein [Pseudomonas sp.]